MCRKMTFDNIRIKLREILNPYLGPLRRIFLKRRDFTIISNNCWGGHVYRYFSLPYSSPTIGLYFFANDYIKFASELKKYINSDIQFISIDQSIHKAELLKFGGKNLTCPIGKIFDIEIIFLHYKSIDEAKTKWNNRKKRIIWDNIIFKMSEMNNCSLDNLLNFDILPYEKKVCFVTKRRNLKSEVLFRQFQGQDNIADDTTNFRRYVNLIKLING